MRVPRFAALACSLTLLAGLQPSGRAQDRDVRDAEREASAAFHAEIAAVQALADRRQWEEARARLTHMLEEHAGAPYVFFRRNQIEDVARLCDYWGQRESPDLDELVSAEVERFAPATGRVKLRYEWGESELNDFERSTSPDGKYEVLHHPARFSGRYTVTLRAKPGALRGAILTVCQEEEEDFQVLVGGLQAGLFQSRLYDHALFHRKLGELELVQRKTPPEKRSERATERISVEVSGTRVKFTAPGVSLQGEKRKDLFGGLELRVPRDNEFSELTIEGELDPSWTNALLERAVRRDWRKFRRAWSAEAALPAWLYSDALAEIASVDPEEELSGRLFGHERDADHWERFTEAHEGGELEGALQELEHLQPDEISPRLRGFLLASLLCENDEVERAWSELSALDDVEHEVFLVGLLGARLRHERGMLHECEAALRRLIDRYPGQPEPYRLLASRLLEDARPAEALKVVEQAVAATGPGKDLVVLGRLVSRAIHGPDWDSVHVWETDRHRVESDINRRTCVMMARELEHVLEQYCRSLRPLDPAGDDKLRVYVFSTRESYLEYTEGLRMAGAENTRGLYSPVLRQLLIWDQPDLEETRSTVRHEGFHQYLDCLMEDPPTWFDEGLAEYYEASFLSKREFVDGAMNGDHVELLGELLDSRGLVPLVSFVNTSAREFRALGIDGYAQAWALVHYMTHVQPGPYRAFERLFDLLASGERARTAVATAFSDVQFDDWEYEFRRYLRGLIEGGAREEPAPDVIPRRVSIPEFRPRVHAAGALDAERRRVFVFGGGLSTAADGSEVGAFDLERGEWSVLEVDGERPRGVTAPSLVHAPSENALYVFGGWALGAEKPSAGLWKLSLDARPMRWRKVPCANDGPSARNGATMVLDRGHGRLIVYGGDAGPSAQAPYTPMSDVWAFDLESSEWHELHTSGRSPAPRWNHSAAIAPGGRSLYVFGGVGYVVQETLVRSELRVVRSDHLFALDLDTLRWSRLPRRGDVPAPRQGASLTLDPEHGELLLAGGFCYPGEGRAHGTSVWIYDLEEGSWTEDRGALLNPRRSHVGIFDPARGEHVLLGGQRVQDLEVWSTVGAPHRDALFLQVAR